MLPQQNTGAQTASDALAPAIVSVTPGGELVTTSLAIGTGTGVQHEAVIKLVRTHSKALEAFGLLRFQIRPRSQGQHGGGDIEYAVLNEAQSTLLIAFMRNSVVVVDFKIALVKEFFRMREQLNAQAPKTFAAALRLAADLEEQKERLEGQNRALESKISADAPKVEFAETIRALDGVCSIEKIAKTIGIGRNKLFKRMKEDKILLPNNLPYQKYIDREYFTVTEGMPYVDSKEVSHPTFTTRVTGAGQVFLARKYGPAAMAAGTTAAAEVAL